MKPARHTTALFLRKYSFDESVKKKPLIIIPTLVQRFTGRLQLNLPCAWLITYLEFLCLCEAMNVTILLQTNTVLFREISSLGNFRFGRERVGKGRLPLSKSILLGSCFLKFQWLVLFSLNFIASFVRRWQHSHWNVLVVEVCMAHINFEKLA